MKEHDILKIEQESVKIEDRKLSLYLKWLSVNPRATWSDVIDALTSINQNKLAQDIKDHICSDALSTDSSITSNFDDVEIIFFPKDDQKVQSSLDELQVKFSHIMREVKSIFLKKVNKNSLLSVEICNWFESYIHLEPGIFTSNNDLVHIFQKVYHYYDFIDCSLIVAMCNEMSLSVMKKIYLMN
ncbi:PREDICTED: uncharacterized protein LOC109584264 [Amphimedon queenslandica]|nr:PREDICTED: uncharacterized protein LOC109584264 [Amphimedon queenslandica]|eukprot:XP_019855504.1 PREDICTED: uncharacterized protein LOC109584264 [Amphimedon queenslandica]